MFFVTLVKNLGDGTYGMVLEAMNIKTREMVAVKRMKRRFDSWDECMGLREIKVLRKLNHENVVKLKEVIRVNGELNLIFEIAKGTILDLIRENKRFRGTRGLPEDVIRNIMSQSLKGMQYIHE